MYCGGFHRVVDKFVSFVVRGLRYLDDALAGFSCRECEHRTCWSFFCLTILAVAFGVRVGMMMLWTWLDFLAGYVMSTVHARSLLFDNRNCCIEEGKG